MSYRDEDIEFANRILTQREELNEEEVAAWLRVKDHVELLDEIAAIRQKLSGRGYGEKVDVEYQRVEQSPDDLTLVGCGIDYITGRVVCWTDDKRCSGYA